MDRLAVAVAASLIVACSPQPTEPADGAQVTVTFAGGAGPVVSTLQYSLPSADVLRLGADEFDRVA